jgi:hypothetical protein
MLDLSFSVPNMNALVGKSTTTNLSLIDEIQIFCTGQDHIDNIKALLNDLIS